MRRLALLTHRLRWRLVFLFLLLLAPTLVLAQATDRRDAFVYGVNAGIPDAVVGTFAPPTVDTIYLMSTETSILSPRITNIYFWPITNDYRASWNVRNDVVEGELEIVRGLQTVATIEQTTYSIQFHQGRASGNKPSLYIGPDAEIAQAQFEADQDAYRQASLDYQAARQAWLAAAQEAQRNGVAPEDFPPAPVEPAPFNTFSTGLNMGFPVKLEPGDYRIRTRATDGTIVPGSEFRLVVFEPRRTAVGYEVIPEQRWTFPEEANDLEGAILGEEGTIIYLKPFVSREYPSLDYARLQDPQDASITGSGEWTWVAGEPIEDATLELVDGGRVVAELPLQAFSVKQTPGGEYGYEILEYSSFTPEITPRIDFVGYRIPLTNANRNFTIQLRAADGAILQDSDRAVRVPGNNSPLILGLISLLPLMVGASIIWWRQQKTTVEAIANHSDQ